MIIPCLIQHCCFVNKQDEYKLSNIAINSKIKDYHFLL